jgi:hypothetical protein
MSDDWDGDKARIAENGAAFPDRNVIRKDQRNTAALKPGDTVLVDFPANPLHGKAVWIVEILPDFNIAPPDSEPMLCELILIDHPSLPRPIGHCRSRLAGTVENARLRSEEADDTRQYEMLV